MYENRHGRFTAVDPLLASGKSANPQTFNRFIYVGNNPLIYGDPDGLQAGSYSGPVYISDDGSTYSNRFRNGFKRYQGEARTLTLESQGVEASYQIRRNGWTLLKPSDDVLKSQPSRAEPQTDNGSSEIREKIAAANQGIDDAFNGIPKGVGNAPFDFLNGLSGFAWSIRNGPMALPDFTSENPLSIRAPFSASNAREFGYMTAASAGVQFGLGAFGGTISAGVSRNPLGLVSEAGTLANVSTRAASSTAFRETGSYLLEFESGKFYAGKGPLSRMNASIKRIEGLGDGLVNSTFQRATSNREAFIQEHRFIESFGGPLSKERLSSTYNRIASPGCKLLGAC